MSASGVLVVEFDPQGKVNPVTGLVVQNANSAVPGIFDFETWNVDIVPSPAGSLNTSAANQWDSRVFFRAAEASGLPNPGDAAPGTPNISTIFTGVTDPAFYQIVNESINPSIVTGFRSGAQSGSDNWAYFSNNNLGSTNPGYSSWVQFEITESTAVPLQYVYDTDLTPVVDGNPPANDFTLVEALAAIDAVPEPTSTALVMLGILFVYRRRR